VVVAGVAVFLGYKIVSWIKAPTPQIAELSSQINDSDWVRGDRQAKIILVEYGDFECPACIEFEPSVVSVLTTYGDKIAFIYRHFPLSQHKNAMPAARAAEAAGLQGKFWEMHDVLNKNHTDWEKESNPKDKFTQYAKELNLDEQKFTSDFDSDQVKNKIQADLLGGQRLGINQTPTFFLNGQKLQPSSFDEFKTRIGNEVKAQTQ
jgi:protein-disulfide isomerase